MQEPSPGTPATFPGELSIGARPLQHRILVVDDDRPMRFLLRRILEGEGHTVDEAADASEAIDRFAPGGFSLVVSDVVMPGPSGIDLRREIARRAPALPVILVSGADVPAGLHYAASTYRTVFLAKPFEPADLIDLVDASSDLDTLPDRASVAS